MTNILCNLNYIESQLDHLSFELKNVLDCYTELKKDILEVMEDRSFDQNDTFDNIGMEGTD